MISSSESSAAVLIYYDMSSLSGTTTSVTATSIASGIQTASNLTRGAGLTASSGTAVFSSSSWSTATSVNTATSTDYIGFNFSTGGQDFSLTSLTLKAAGSGTAPSTLAVYYSTNGFASAVQAGSNQTILSMNNASPTSLSYSFDSVVGTSLEVRIYGFGANGVDGTSASATGGTIRFDDITLNGSLSAVPEPSTYAALCGAGALVYGIWRRRRAGSVAPTADS